VYQVFHTVTFDREAEKLLSLTEQQMLRAFEQRLSNSPNLGKPLGYDFFREKKLDGKRAYFLVYNEHRVIIFVRVSTKNRQQAVIDEIKKNVDTYRSAADAFRRSGGHARP
jgi:hypothetical protein